MKLKKTLDDKRAIRRPKLTVSITKRVNCLFYKIKSVFYDLFMRLTLNERGKIILQKTKAGLQSMQANGKWQPILLTAFD